MPTLFKDAAKVIVGNGDVLEHVSVRIDGNVISKIGRNLPPDGADIVDCTGKVVMPGLIDVHVHIAMWAGEVDWGNILDIPDEYLAMRATTYLQWWIQNGFTTIFEPLARRDLPFEMRRALRDGVIAGPRLLVSGPAIVGTGARGMFFGPREITGVDDARRAVREQISIYRNADIVKIMATSEMLTGHVESRVQLTAEEIAAMVDEAHKAGAPVHCHAYGGPGVKLAVDNGVDLIVHGAPIGWEFEPNLAQGSWQLQRRIDGGKFENTDYMGNYDLMARKGTFWAPTLSYFYKIYFEHWEEFQRKINPFIVGRAQLVGESIERNFRLAHEAGVPIVLGSDTGMPFTYHGDAAWELRLFVRFGMSAGEAIQAATGRAAKALWIDDRTGTIEVGKRGDVLVLGADPLADIAVLSTPGAIEKVYLEGKLSAENNRAVPVSRESMMAQLEKLETLDELLTHRSPYDNGALGKRIVTSTKA
ncbi:metal-dependent hydrolase family protein [Chelatococcus reniformis]|uniref:Xaa-Pro dipeptidase n=1 Tax=Chelatococcus reniformis TaxID=1494448 RepID=A0A916TX77_9HYPH|nr:amidohydrolase family protein [Chelatococcus reniformis]GGC50239.1 Xaa-Pro dipeptidase [Chelatococcus reniformis]